MRAALLAFFFCVIATPAAADRFAMTYEGAAFGLAPLGTISVDADVSDDSYVIRANMRSGGLLNFFERTNLTAESSGVINGAGVVWRSYDLDHHYSRKRRQIAMRLDENGAMAAEITPNYRLWGDPPASEAQRRASRDPLSSMVAMAIDVGRTRRCQGAYPTFDGRFHYVLELGDGRIDHYDSGGYEGEVLRCSLSYIAVSGFEARDAGRRRIPRGQVWFALIEDSNYAPVVRIVTPASTGGVVVYLTSFRRVQVDVDFTAAAASTP
ncbi:MAG: DUF3108 domain-containing protein [Hyphomonadaceae bacterium]|nr:DUF3108 domain-containing protein [Hyphomonadaceae bacterium]MBX3511486.1 DUF3108 domain-containing protein [Hyphomonadaceae bacterium]